MADIVTKYMQGADGRTGHERLCGKQVHEGGLEFGKRVLWRKHRSKDTNVVLDARERRESGLVAGGIEPSIVLLSTTSFLKCVQCSVDHWQNDGVESLVEIFEQFRGGAWRHFFR